MDEEKQKLHQNFVKLEEDLVESPYKEDFSILREAWNIEISKPGCTQCIKNAAMAKYSQIGANMLMHDLSIEDSKKIHDLRAELGKEHQEVQKRINEKVEAEIKSLQGSNESTNESQEDPFKELVKQENE